jgi:feruloyl-CoA synthase
MNFPYPAGSPRQLDLSRYRGVCVGEAAVDVSLDESGVWRMASSEALRPVPRTLVDCLVRGAEDHPDRTLAGQRGPDGGWRRLSYADMLCSARSIGQALLDRGLSAERPLMIVSGNDLQHLQLALGAMYAGVPFCPVSPMASTISKDYGKLKYFVSHMTPGLVFASDAAVFGPAIRAAVPGDVEVNFDIAETGLETGSQPHKVSTFASLLATRPSTVDSVHAGIGADTIAKFLFTSGSTKLPKAVVTTHRMLCSNQQMLLQTFPCFGEKPPVLLDWLPWSHTFGGSHDLGIALYNGGSFYIDDGRPTPNEFAATVRNLKEIAPTVFFNVPKGWELLTEALQADPVLRETFFSRVQLFFFGGAGLSQAAWNRLESVSEAHCGERIRIMAGLGMTETSPSCTFTTGPVMMAGYVGLPAPGCDVKLVPVDGKYEIRFRGPHVMPGYWRAPEATARAFDEEGYYCSGDAVRFADPNCPETGLMFDGRIAEDFKLSSGTFVSVGPLRARVISEGAPYIFDVVVAGIDRDVIGLLVFPRIDNCRELSGLGTGASSAQILASAPVRQFFQDLLARLNREATGSASRVDRMVLLAEPPSIARGEQTDKGSINQRTVLANRAELVTAMYEGGDADVLYAS